MWYLLILYFLVGNIKEHKNYLSHLLNCWWWLNECYSPYWNARRCMHYITWGATWKWGFFKTIEWFYHCEEKVFFISRVQQTGTGFLFYFNGEFSLLIVLRSKTEIFSLPPKLMIKNCTVYDFESWEKIGSNKRVV